MQTLYQHGREEILRLIVQYLELVASSDSLRRVEGEHFENADWRLFLCCGVGLSVGQVPTDPAEAARAYEARSAIPHDLEAAVSGPLYVTMHEHALALAARAAEISNGFSQVSAEQLVDEPELLPAFLHAAGTFSKSVLQKTVGQVSDTGLSRPAAQRLADFFKPRLVGDVAPAAVVDRLGSTIEGQVRDLLGRYLLEALVEAALQRGDVPFQREEEYEALAGVVYDHRADFVVPNAAEPRLFIEVRKSSARHASLYAKDKMFSAINWKGRHPELIGVLIADGEWTRHSLLALARVFDYVLPVTEADELANVARAYLDGDESRLLRVIHFSIEERLQT